MAPAPGRCDRRGVGWLLRSARVEDRTQILDVVRAAFGVDGRDGGEEVDIVRRTWARSGSLPDLELVAVEAGRVIGHALGGRGELGGEHVVAVAPLCVAPARQARGVGSALMTELLTRADERGWPLAVVLGDPGYYGRVGFRPASVYGVSYPPAGDGPHFQLCPLSSYDPALTGSVRYCWEGDD